jgi:hypothetical protein
MGRLGEMSRHSIYLRVLTFFKSALESNSYKLQTWHVNWTVLRRRFCVGSAERLLKIILTATGVLSLSYVAGCAKVRFDDKISASSCQGFNQVCISTAGRDNFSYGWVAPGGQIDILIVNDNSASMSFEQKLMAERFSRFLSVLDTKKLDYRIGVTTTDIANTGNPPREINQNGNLQNGKLVTFADGSSFITPLTANKEAIFSQAVKRGETLNCEAYLRASPEASQGSNSYLSACPTPDERGIYAASLTIEGNFSGFIRESANLAIIFLSDEDVRSSIYDRWSSFFLDERDMPSSLISMIKTKYPNKIFTAHSLIVRPGGLANNQSALAVETQIRNNFSILNASGNPNLSMSSFFSGGDSACLSAQSQQTPGVNGSYGYLYALLTRMTSGIEASICSTDYAKELNAIGSDIIAKKDGIAIACSFPDNVIVTRNDSNGPVVPAQVEGNTLRLGENIEAGDRVWIQYSCPTQ